MFPTDEACRRYLAELRWPEGFRCPRCQNPKAWPVRAGRLWHCAACGHQTSVTAGTLFQDTRTPLTTWFRAMWWVTTPKSGMSAVDAQRLLGLRSYTTAWTWLHKLRRAMVRPGRDRLIGRVEVDETYWGAAEAGVRGRQLVDKLLVAVAVEQVGRRGLGRIRLRQIPDASAASLEAFVKGPQQPPLEQPHHAVHPRQQVPARGFSLHPCAMSICGLHQPSVRLPPVSVDGAAGFDRFLHERLKTGRRRVRNLPQPNAPQP